MEPDRGPEQPFTRTRRDKEAGASFPLGQAFRCAGCGILHALRTQRNMRIHCVVAAVAVALGALLQVQAWAWCAIVGCIAVVLAAECLNTAIEAAVDLLTEEYHDLARTAKDCAAGAVYLCALGAVVVGLVVFVPPILELLGATL